MSTISLKETEKKLINPLTTADAAKQTIPLFDDVALGEGEHEGIGARDCIHGYLFHMQLCVLFVLRSFELRKRGVMFSIAAEHKPLNPFDDIVCWVKTNEEKVYHLMQVKHARRTVINKITAKDLTKTRKNNWGDRFTLYHYIQGYCKVKKIPVFASAPTNFIVTTNIDIDLDDVRNGGISIELCKNHTFSQIMKESDGRCYRLVPKEKSNFYQALKKYSGANDEELKMFLEDFIMAVNLPDVALLENIINKDIGKLCDFSITKAIGSELQKKILEWFNRERGIWLNEENIEKLLKEVEAGIVSLTLPSLDYSEILKDMNVLLGEECIQHFKSKIADFINPHSMEHLLIINVRPKKSILTVIKLHQALQQLAKDSFQFLLVRFRKQKEYLKLFKFRFTVNVLVIYCKSKDNILCHQKYLRAICKICVERCKKIILISEEEIKIENIKKSVPLLNATCDEDGGFRFLELNSETQMRLFNKEAIIFQENENKISLSSLCHLAREKKSETTNLLKEIIDSSTLVSLIKNNGISVGNIVKDSRLFNNIYIERNLELCEDSKGSRSEDSTKTLIDSTLDDLQGITEDKFLQEDSRVVMITDEAGMGKTALLNSLVRKLRMSDRKLWICRINLINFTKVLKMELEKGNPGSLDNANNIDLLVEHLMEMQEYTKLRTEFEKKLFRMAIEGHIKLILFFDGFDEICPIYEDIITSLLLTLQESKIKKLFVTARTHEGQQLKVKLTGTLWKIVPLNRYQKMKYLFDYWGKAFGLEDLNNSLQQEFYKVIWFIVDTKPIPLPLHLVLIAEYLQEQIREVFYSSSSVDSNLYDTKGVLEWVSFDTFVYSKKFQDASMLNYFVEKTFTVYQTEKSKDSKGNICSDNQFHYFINAVRKVHFHLGLIETLGEEAAKLISGEVLKIDEWMEAELPKIGILQRIGDDYHFINHLFAEYFTYEFIRTHPDKLSLLHVLDADPKRHYITWDCMHDSFRFSMQLCMLFILRSFELRKRGVMFSIAAEHGLSSPFDDIVCVVEINKLKTYHFMRVEHGRRTATKKITAKDLTEASENNWRKKFTLHHYVQGYCKVKKMPVFASAQTNFIVATNIDIDLDDVRNSGISIKLCENHTFSQIMKESDRRCYRLVPEEKSDFYKELKKSSGANDEEMKMFLEDFIMAFNLPDSVLLENIIDKDIGKLCDFSITKAIGSELRKQLLEWIYRGIVGIWLNDKTVGEFRKELSSSLSLIWIILKFSKT